MQAQIIKFDEFELDLGRYELRRQGQSLKLEKVPMELLILLAERDGQLVTRDEIIQRLWGPNVFVDTRQGINTAVRKIRLALSDDPDNPRILQTVFGKGYRLLAPLTTISNYREDFRPSLSPQTAVARAGMAEPAFEAEPPSGDADLITTSTRPISGVVGSNAVALPGPINPNLARGLFLVIQSGYLVLYAAAFALLGDIAKLGLPSYVLTAILVAGLIGAAVRLYLIAAVAFNYSGSARLFRLAFPGILVLDTLWAASPLLLFERLGYLTLLCAAALAFLPFSQRTLVLSMVNVFRSGTTVKESGAES